MLIAKVTPEIMSMINPDIEFTDPKVDAVNKILSYLFHSRTQTHIWHLQTKSYAEHKALNAYYDGIVELLDRFGESAAGCIGVPTEIVAMNFLNYQDGCSCKHFDILKGSIMECCKPICDYRDLMAILDEIIELISQTKYLLKLQ